MYLINQINFRFSRYRQLCCLLILALSICQEVEGQSISPLSNHWEVLDISYHFPAEPDDSLRQLNLVLPEGSQLAPLLVWIGGGAWSYVDRHQEMDLARGLADQGIAVASVGHRLSSAVWKDSSLTDGHQHPDHIQDLAEAIKWLTDHAGDYGYDPANLFVGGYSSGAQLAALLVSNLAFLEEAQVDPGNIQGVIPISGTYDIHNYYEVFKNGVRPELAKLHVESVFGDPANFEEASPANFIDHLKTPMLLISDSNMYNYTKLYEEKIQASSFRDLEIIYIQHLDHAGLWRDLSFAENSIYRNHLVGFIKKHCKKSG